MEPPVRLRNEYGAYDPAHAPARNAADQMIQDAAKILTAAGLDESDVLAFIVETTSSVLSGQALMRGAERRRAERCQAAPAGAS